MTTILPLNSLIPLINPSILSKSKWFVGSSNKIKCGFNICIELKDTRAFCPPDKFFIFVFGKSKESIFLIPNFPNIALQIVWSNFEFKCCKYSIGVNSNGKLSIIC